MLLPISLTSKVLVLSGLGAGLLGLRVLCGYRLRYLQQRLLWQGLLPQLLASTVEMEPLLERLVVSVRNILQCDRVVLYRLDDSWHGTFVAEALPADADAENARSGWLGAPTAAELQQLGAWQKGQLLKAMANATPVAAESESAEGHRGELPLCLCDDGTAIDSSELTVLTTVGVKAHCTVPLYNGSQLWGLLLCYQHGRARRWRTVERQQLRYLGQQLSRFIQQSLLQQQQQRQIQTLQSEKAAALAANQSKSEFLANMSHELRTPLNAILGFTQVLQGEAADALPPDQRQSVDIISRSGEHLLRLVNDILDMSKIEAGQMVLNEQSFDLHQLLATLEDMLRLRAESKGIALTFRYPEDTPQYIHADEQKLRQILLNLLGNAIKFTQVGEVTCRVWAEYLEPDSQTANPIQLFIAVEDTGPGINGEALETLFEAFHQVQGTGRPQEGTGLGLTISRRFVQLMGGKLGVISELGSGSTFTVRIPCQWRAQAQPVDTTTPVVAPTRGYRMLVTDDDATSRLLLTKLFGAAGHEIRQAANGQEAVKIWHEWKPDLVWMDIRMPLMDGCEATRRIKAADIDNQTTVIALTASAFEEQRQMMLASGCNDFVRKPFRREELLGKIQQHLAPSEPTVLSMSMPRAS